MKARSKGTGRKKYMRFKEREQRVGRRDGVEGRG